MLIVGLPFTVPMEDSCLLSSLPWRGDFWRLHLELGMKRKKKQIKIARGIFRSLAPLLGTAPREARYFLGNCRLSLGLWYQAYDSGT